MEEEAAEEQVMLPAGAGPQIISAETISPAAAGVGAAAGRGATSGGGGGGGAGAAGAELGRRLLLAARAGDAQLLLALLAQGAPFTADWLGTSPLHLAAAGGHAGAAGVLLRAGVSRDARTKVERTPLHLAAAAGHARVAALLLEHGALLDCRDMLRMTPLHWACARGHAALAALLARRGADPDARCKFGRTPRALAQQHPATARALAQALAEREGAQTTEEMVVDESEVLAPNTLPVEDEKPTGNMQPKLTKANLDTEARSDKTGGAAALLRQHGITLLPADDGSTVLSALQSGRTVVLSDAGKLMLKENSQVQPAGTPTPAPAAVSPPTPSVGAGSLTPGAAPRLVLRARPARSPPRPGVKVFTVNKLTRAPVADNTQIKYVHLPKEPAASHASVAGGAAGGAGGRGGVKIIMNKASFAKLVATAARAHHSGDNEPLPEMSGVGPGVVCVPEQFVRSVSARYLRAQLLAAHAALAALAAELRRARAARS